MNILKNITGPPLPIQPNQTVAKSAVEKSTDSFSNILKGMVDGVNDAQITGDKAITDLQSGNAEHLHEVMIAVEKADISMRMLVQIRNKAITAYEELMRMQI